MRLSRVAAGLTAAASIAAGLSGCWDQLSIAQRSAAVALRVKPAGRHEYRWTFYFPNPTVTVSSISNLSPPQQFYTVSAVTPSLGQAYVHVDARLARDLYLGQMEDLLISRSLDWREVSTIIRAYNRVGILPKTVYVLGIADNLTFPRTIQEPEPHVYYTRYFNCRVCQPIDSARQEWQVWDEFVTPGVSPHLPYATAPTHINRLLVYSAAGPPKMLNADETAGWAYLTGRARKLSLSVKSPRGPVVVINLTGHPTTETRLKDGELHVSVRLNLHGELAQWPGALPLTPREVRRIEAQISRRVIRQCVQVVDFANRTNTDPFGWTRAYLYAHPDLWPRRQPGQARIWPIRARLTVTTSIATVGVSL